MENLSVKSINQKCNSFFKEPKKPKLNNQGQKITKDSDSEGDLYVKLVKQEKDGLIEGFDIQAKEELYAYGKHICNYYVDFKVYHKDGSIEYIEHKSKATETEVWRMKFAMLQAKYKDDKNVKISINRYKGYRIIQTKK